MQTPVVPCVSPKSAARLAGLVGVAPARPFQMPRFGPDGEIPKATAACAGSDSKGRLSWHPDLIFPGLDPAVSGALDSLGVKGLRRKHAVLGARLANELQTAAFVAEYGEDHAELLAQSTEQLKALHRRHIAVADELVREFASTGGLGPGATMSLSFGGAASNLSVGLEAQRRLESTPAILQKIAHVATDGSRLPLHGVLVDSGASCSVLDEETARSLVEAAGSAVIHPLERGDLTAIHGVGGQRCTTGVCVASLSCWCEEAGAWVDFQLLAFVLAGKPPLRIIGNSFLRYHKAVIDVATCIILAP